MIDLWCLPGLEGSDSLLPKIMSFPVNTYASVEGKKKQLNLYVQKQKNRQNKLMKMKKKMT